MSVEIQPEFLLSSYDYDLPESLIAQYPVEPRDESRLLVVDRARQTWEHRRFLDLPAYLNSGDLVVANNTRVLKARLLGQRLREEKGLRVLGGKIEFVLLEELRPNVWEGLFHAAAKHKPGVRFEIPTPDGRGLRGTLLRGASESPHGTVVAEFDRDPVSSGAGEIPLPHYIKRSEQGRWGDRAGDLSKDDNQYQTIYARETGSAAAPTAGLHFSGRVLEKLKQQQVSWTEVTLHVGLGTFRPVKAEDIREHQMHEERYEITPQAAAAINGAREQGGKILAVGTTSVRTLESAWRPQSGQAPAGIRPGCGRTALFIHPKNAQFHVVDRLLTNFHLPKSTLLMLVSAFGGRELILSAYREAVRERYRFFSYGDAMLII